MTKKLSLIAFFLSAILPCVHAGDNFGRLFFTQEERLRLDRQRQANPFLQSEIARETTITVNGSVVRSNGQYTVWVNGVARDENSTADEFSITPLKANSGRIFIHRANTLNKGNSACVGDTIIYETGKINNLLGEGIIHIRKN